MNAKIRKAIANTCNTVCKLPSLETVAEYNAMQKLGNVIIPLIKEAVEKELGIEVYAQDSWKFRLAFYAKQSYFVRNGVVFNIAFNPEYSEPFDVHPGTIRELSEAKKGNRYQVTDEIERAFYGYIKCKFSFELEGKPAYLQQRVSFYRWIEYMNRLHPEWYGKHYQELSDNEKLDAIYQWLVDFCIVEIKEKRSERIYARVLR